MPAAEIAVGIAAAIDGDLFEHHLPDLPDMKAVAEFNTTNIEKYFRGSMEMMGD